MALSCATTNAFAQQPQVDPPQAISTVPPVYPESAQPGAGEVTVELLVLIDEAGQVGEVQVATSGGPEFDQAAIDAVRQWHFAPATKDNVAIASRIRVPLQFVQPAPEPATAPAAVAAPAPDPAAATAPATEPAAAPAPETAPAPAAEEPPPDPTEVHVHGKAAAPARGSSDFTLNREVIDVAPHSDAGSVLGSAPGVYVARPEGDAVGHEIFLRGFDAEHGQDVALSAAGIPINLPSHLHGQGYADLGFIPPEVIRSVRVTEGIYDPRQGDFAVAGSVDFDLGLSERGLSSHTSYGSFDTVRQLLLWAPEGEDEETFGAVALKRSSGFGENRGSSSALAMGQYVMGTDRARTILHASAYGARAGLAGVLRQDDIDAGRVGFYDSYDDPTANAQSAFSSRLQVGMRHERTQPSGAQTQFGLWWLETNFRLRENFTGYRERSQLNPEWVGRGDLIEQSNLQRALGGNASYRTGRYKPAPWATATGEVGLSFRGDSIEQAQNLLQPPQNETWDQRVDASIRGANIGAYADSNWTLTRYVGLRGGVRADALYYDVDDRLGNFIPSFRRDSYLVGFRRTALGFAVGPRATLEVRPLEWLTALASYGRGYRSPQARQLDEGESAPYARVDSGEVGLKMKAGDHEEVTLTTAAFWTHLSTDLAFDPGEGRLERIGPTTRRGVVAHAIAKPTPWSLASVSATWVQATLDSPPVATAENPTPAYRKGELLPYVPPVVVRADVGLADDLFEVGGAPLNGQLGTGLTYLSPRPLPFGDQGDPVWLLDARARVGWRAFDLTLDVSNLLDLQYAASEYSFVSDWGAGPTPSLLPARHISAGAPRAFLATLGVHL